MEQQQINNSQNVVIGASQKVDTGLLSTAYNYENNNWQGLCRYVKFVLDCLSKQTVQVQDMRLKVTDRPVNISQRLRKVFEADDGSISRDWKRLYD